MKKRLSAEEFVREWQAAESLDEFIKLYGLSKNAAMSRAYYYRTNGVGNLKWWGRRQPRVNYAALNHIAERLTPKEKKGRAGRAEA